MIRTKASIYCNILASGQFRGLFQQPSLPIYLSRLSTNTRVAESEARAMKSYNDLPGPGAIENLLTFMRKGGLKNLNEIQIEKFQKFGPIFRERLLGAKCVHVCDAEAIETVARSQGTFPSRGFDAAKDMLKDIPMYALIGNTDYKAWKAARSPIAPTFLRPIEIQKFAPGVNAVAKDAVKRLRGQLDNNGMVPQLKHEMDGYATENILLLIYNERMGFYKTPQNQKIFQFMQTARDLNDILLKSVEGISGQLKLWRYIATPIYKKFIMYKELLFRLGNDFAEIREQKQEEDEHVCLYDKITNMEGKNHFVNGIAIALSQVGVETTGTALLWCLYYLSRNPEAQEKAYNEIVKAIGTSSNDKSSENPKFHAHLTYIKACIKESLRLSQVAIFHAKVLEREAVLCGYNIPANSLVCLWHSHLSHSSEHFQSPEEFKPERWQRGESKEKINPFSYIPFGFGVRMCLGRRFAELELVHGVAHILQNFHLEYMEKEKMRGIFTSGGFWLPEKELPVKFMDRL